MKRLISLLSLTLICTAAVAQEFKNQAYIDVNGSADTLVVPDQIFLRITLKERESGRDEVSLNKLEADLKSGVEKIGLDLEKLSLANANADYVQVKWNKKDVVTQTVYELELADATQLAKALEMLDELKIEDAYISRVKHSQEDAIRDAVEKRAILNAKHKADLLLNAIGEQTGSPLVIRSINNSPVQRMDAMNSNINISYESPLISGVKTKNDVGFKKLNYQASIYVKFSIAE